MNQKTFSDLHEHLLIEFDGLSNLDSSIWLFEDASTKAEWLVLGGDAVLSGWQRLLAKERLSPYALKISHHGKEDALNGWLLQEISPAWLLITTNYCDYEKHYHRWETLSGSEKCSLFVLGHDQKTRWLEAELPGEP